MAGKPKGMKADPGIRSGRVSQQREDSSLRTAAHIRCNDPIAIDELGWSRHRATVTMGTVITFFGVLNALSLGGNGALSSINLIGRESTQGVFGTMDYLASNWFLPVGGFLIALFCGWLLNTATTRKELEDGHGPLVGYGLWRFLIRFVAPLAVGAIIVSVILGKEYQ